MELCFFVVKLPFDLAEKLEYMSIMFYYLDTPA